MKKECLSEAVIYTRYARTEQFEEAEDLQKNQCQQFAKDHDLKVVEHFEDTNFSGSGLERPGLQAMLAFLSAEQEKQYAVIVQDQNRLSTNTADYLQIKNTICVTGHILKSPSFNTADTLEGQFFENILAAKVELGSALDEEG